jgi:hypothetical protein
MESPTLKLAGHETEVHKNSGDSQPPLKLGGLKRPRASLPVSNQIQDVVDLAATPESKKKKTVRVAFTDDA